MGRPPRKKKDIERSALELFVERGVDGTSIRDIAERASVTEGALYRHHKSKSDLVKALFHQHYEVYAEVIRKVRDSEDSFDSRIQRIVDSFFALYDEDPYIFHFVMTVRHQLLDEVRLDDRNPVELLSRILREAMERDEIPRQDTELTTQLLLGMVLQAATGQHYGRIKTKLASCSEAVSRACLVVARGGAYAME